MQKAHDLFYCVRVVGNSTFLFWVGLADEHLLPQCIGTAKTPVFLRCGLTGKQGQRAVVALALALYRGGSGTRAVSWCRRGQDKWASGRGWAWNCVCAVVSTLRIAKSGAGLLLPSEEGKGAGLTVSVVGGGSTGTWGVPLDAPCGGSGAGGNMGEEGLVVLAQHPMRERDQVKKAYGLDRT